MYPCSDSFVRFPFNIPRLNANGHDARYRHFFSGPLKAGRRNHDLLQTDRTWRVEVVAQLLGNVFDYFLSLNAVPRLIEWGRKNGNGPFAGDDGYNPTPNSALCV